MKIKKFNEYNETEQLLAFDDQIKDELRNLLKNTNYQKGGIVDQRIEQLFNIHKKWLDMAKRTYSADVIAKKFYDMDKNLF
jgi:hypothetical protein